WWAKIVGYTLEELSPISINTWINLCHPDDLENSNKLLEEHSAGKTDYYFCEVRMKHKKGHWVWIQDRGKISEWGEDGKPLRITGTHIDITERKKAEKGREKLIKALQEALENIKTLSGLLPICAHCKKIRDDKGYWNNLEGYIQTHSEAKFSHGMCPECSDEVYGKEDWYIEMKKEEKKKT
ncbi:MAG: PAS domain-containing protein, partial [Desulfobacula sp.]|nr:PAS domain-containing protein [Desulfobacula sp.]